MQNKHLETSKVIQLRLLHLWNLIIKNYSGLYFVGLLLYFICFMNFIYFKICFNWRLITIQYCSGFCHTLIWICHRCICVPHPEPPLPPPSPSHPSGSCQCTGPEHPVLGIKPGLAVCFTYDNIPVSMLFSQIIPPLSSSTESKRLFYTSFFFNFILFLNFT